jgi:acyl-CoA synthetase (AMP-forming)/AMP-acid ligase II
MYLTQGLHRSLQQTPDAVATVCEDRVRTFREQADRVSRLAGALRGLDVRADDRVGILARNSDRYSEALLATAWAGAVFNPVNIRWSVPETVFGLRESGTDVLLVDPHFVDRVPDLVEGHRGLKTVVLLGSGPDAGMPTSEVLIRDAEPVEDVRRGGDAPAGIFYTGGTTGFPKGVMLSHANLVAAALGQQATTPTALPGGCSLVALPMFHLGAFVTWTPQLLVGGSHAFVPGFDPVAVLEAVDRHGVTTVALLPTMIQMLVDHPDLPRYDLSSLRSVVYGGSPISQPVLERAMAAVPGASFVQVYGMTEIAPPLTVLTPEDHATSRLLRSAGRAAAHTEVRIVDREDREVPRGTVGELVARGAPLMLGYWNEPGATAAVTRGGWMHTGDGAWMDDDGYVFIVDRVKDMIITGGENVYSTEVENALNSHPAVAACAVIGVPDDTWGERVHAVVVLRPGQHATASDIETHCAGLIATYKKPRSCSFVEALPLSAAGKVIKSELRRPFWQDRDRDVN